MFNSGKREKPGHSFHSNQEQHREDGPKSPLKGQALVALQPVL